jgi:hypothetical protein
MDTFSATSETDDFALECPKCSIRIPAPHYLAQEKPVYDPLLGTFRTRVHIGPNDVEYRTHVMSCG